MTEKIAKITKNQMTVFFVAFLILIATIFMYLFFINQTIVNVAERSVMEERLSHLDAKISSLEFELISTKNNIDLDVAYSLGFESVSQPQFITRRSLGQATVYNSLQ